MALTEADRMCLIRARIDTDAHQTWPARAGNRQRGRRLAKMGLLREAGISAMGWKLFVITDAGRAALAPSAAETT